MGEEREWRLDGADEGSQSKGQWFGFEEEVDDIAVARELPVLPLRGVAVFPSAVVPLLISRDSSLALVEEALLGDRVIALNAQRAAEIDDPGPSDVYPRGCAGRILKMLKYPDGSIRILVQGVRRLELGEFLQVKPYLRATVTLLQDRDDSGVEVAAMKTRALQSFARLVELTPYIPDELQVVAVNIRSPGKVADLIAANLNLPVEEKQAILETLEVRPRLTQLTSILEREVELLELGQQIHGQVQSELHRNQKEFYLRQQLKAIRKELGESEGLSSETEMLAQRIFEARLPEEARKVAEAELDRLALIPPESAEHSVVRTYVEWLADIPWS
ncbi:MAG: LON peptidase substrate-binding domain-containing protein, partial [Candidatus Binatia bacterium]